MKKLILILSVVFYTTLAFSQEFGTFTDPRDGKTYKTSVVLGNTWLAENLAYKVDDEGYKLFAAKCCYYTWEVAKDVCPQGWRLPTIDDIKKIQDYYGTGRLHWPGEVTGLELAAITTESGAFFWTSTTSYNQYAWGYSMECRLIYRSRSLSHGAVRCIKK